MGNNAQPVKIATFKKMEVAIFRKGDKMDSINLMKYWVNSSDEDYV